METRFEVRTTCFDTMLNYCLSQKPKLLENSEFNYLTIIVTILIFHLER